MIDSAVRTVHLLVAAVWAGSVCYVAVAVLPLARDGAFKTTAPLEALSSKLTAISRASAAVLLLTGGHLAAAAYTVDGEGGPDLFGTTNGRLVLAMTGLWFVLIGLVEVGSRRLDAGLSAKKLREPARNALTIYRLAALVALALLVVAGLITTGAGARLF